MMTFNISILDNAQRKNRESRPRSHSDWQPVKAELYKLVKKELKLSNKEMDQIVINRRGVSLIDGTVSISGYIVGDVDDKLLKKIDKKVI